MNQGQGSGTTTRSTPTSDQATQDAAKRGANTASTGTQPANTKQNKVDRDSASVTPTDQGESETDRKITQEIRQAVMRDGTLSFTAKNVKIITSRGKVTLRGSVKSDQERTTIVAAAKRVAGVTDVDDQIEVNK